MSYLFSLSKGKSLIYIKADKKMLVRYIKLIKRCNVTDDVTYAFEVDGKKF